MIRPIDLQNTILQSMQTAPLVQRAEEGPGLAAQAVQAEFAAELTHRDERVAATAEVTGNRVGAKPDERGNGSRGEHRNPDLPFKEVVDGAAVAAGEPDHLVDFTA